MLEEALAYASRGWPVFPLRPRDKRPATEHWRDDATTDPAKIRKWWSANPDANIGLVTGEKSGFWVVDLDLKGDICGSDNLADLEERYGYLSDTIEQATPSGGRHLLFRWPSRPIGNSAGKIAPGIDTRGDGGYIVASPSIHPNGKSYAWAEGRDPAHGELAEAPEWLIGLLDRAPASAPPPEPSEPANHRTDNRYVEQAVINEAREVANAGDGTRNDRLNQAAFKLGGFVASKLLAESTVKTALLAAARSNGLVSEDGEAAVLKTIESGLKKGAQKLPREVPERSNGHDRKAHRSPTSHSAVIVGDRPADLMPLDFIDISRWIGLEPPPREWLAAGLIPKRQVTLLTGDGGLGKSMLLLQLIVAAARGAPWLGREVKPCRVIALFCEDEEDEIWRRIIPVCKHYECGLTDILDHARIRSEVEDNSFLAEADRYQPLQTTALLTRLERAIYEFKPGLIALDSSYDVFGGDDVDTKHVRDFVRLLRSISINHDCAVLLNAHPSKASLNSGAGYAGSVAWHNKIRRRLWLTRPIGAGDDEAPDDNLRVLRGMKNNSGPSGGDIELEWRDGVFHPIAERGAVSQLDRLTTEGKFLDLLLKTESEGQRTSPKSRADNYAPRVFSKHPQGKNFSAGDYAAAMRRLLDRGRLKIVAEGPASRRFHYLVANSETPKT